MSKLILGTAGHIDHGKTALVRALTGTDTDRLPEEKKRGITIDLGFASLQLGDLSIGIVDVPGHEDFIRNMLAGATGLDAVMLVIAADEGVMPQTREHLAILDLLNIRNGIVAVTKSDLVDADWLSLVVDDARATLAGTTLASAPVIAVSAKTGAGLDELKSGIAAQIGDTARRADDLFRMPIDRVFTVRGTGTVATGTVWSGRITSDASVTLLPAGQRARVRGIQVHGAAVNEAIAGQRAAIAVNGIEKDAVDRGDVVVNNDEWSAEHMLTLRARVIADSAWTLEPRQRVHVHLGTAQVLARVVLLDAPLLNPGDEGWVQLRLESAVVARAGDRVVLRSYSPVTTIAGGVVVEIGGRKRSEIDEATAERLLRVISDDGVVSIRAAVAAAGRDGIRQSALSIHTPHSPGGVADALAALPDAVQRVGERWFERDVVEEVVGGVITNAQQLHTQNALRSTLDRTELRAAMRDTDAELVEYAIDRAVLRGELVAEGSRIRRPGHAPVLSARQETLRKAAGAALAAAGLAPPSVSELAQSLGGPPDLEPVLQLLAEAGQIVLIAPDLYVDAGALAEATRRTRTELAHSQELAAADFRATLPVSRKHLIPLLEYFDRIGVTRRTGDLRRVEASESA